MSLIIKRCTGYCRGARFGMSARQSETIKCRLYIIFFFFFFCCCIILWLPGLSTSTVLLLIKKTVDVITFGDKWSTTCLIDVQILIQEVALNKMIDLTLLLFLQLSLQEGVVAFLKCFVLFRNPWSSWMPPH